MTVAVVYVAWGSGIPEAIKSVKSFKKHNRDVEAYIYSNKAFIDGFDYCKMLKIQGKRPFTKVSGILKSCELLEKYDGLLFLDSDTLVLGNISELLGASKHHDIAMVRAPFHGNSKLPQVYKTFNSGVISYGSQRSVNLIYDWAKHVVGKDSDQYTLSNLIYTEYLGALDVLSLPPEYNARTGWPFVVSSKVKIIHGRGNLDRVARVVNNKPAKRRVWIPSRGMIYN